MMHARRYDRSAAENIKEIMVVQDNGFDTLWYIMKVVAKMMDTHRAPAQPKYKGSMSQHARAWDVYSMMLHHQSTIFKDQDCSVGFLWDIIDPRFSVATKVELGMLTGLMIAGLARDPNWVMPVWYEVRTMSVCILENSPENAIKETDLGRGYLQDRQ
jgi:hypothetical protein